MHINNIDKTLLRKRYILLVTCNCVLGKISSYDEDGEFIEREYEHENEEDDFAQDLFHISETQDEVVKHSERRPDPIEEKNKEDYIQ